MQAEVFADRMHTANGTPRFKEVLLACIFAVLVSALYVALTAWHGAVGVARSDDWAYYRAAFALARDGSFSADPWTFTMLIGHLVLAQPVIALFGSSMAALQLMVAVLSAVALMATYLVIRSFLPPKLATFAVGCLALGPIYGTLSVSYMTDVPAFAFEVLVLLTGLQALRSSRFSFQWFIVSLLLGVVAFSIREYALAAPAAVSVVTLRRLAVFDRAKMRRVAVLVALGLIAVATMYFWRHKLPGASHVPRPAQAPFISVAYVCSAAFTIALFTFPMLFLISGSVAARLIRDRSRVAIITLGCIISAWALLLLVNGSVLPGNMLTAHGSYPETLPGQPPVVLPFVLWQGLSVLSLFSFLSLAVVALARHSTKGVRETSSTQTVAQTGVQLCWVFSLLMFGEIAAVKFATPGVITDRYLIPIVPFIIGVALHWATKSGILVVRPRTRVIASLALMALLGTTVVDAAATFDGAKWKIATSVQRSGIAPELIDGGYEWFGYHQPGKIVDFKLDAPARNWWDRLFVHRDMCVETRNAATSPVASIDGGKIISELKARALFGVNYDLVAVRTTKACVR
jgi:hypothetical protein